MQINEWRDSGDKKEIEDRMMSSLSVFEDDRIREILMDRISPSKRIRSYILLALTDSRHECMKNVLIDICVALELVQQASLIFDDTIDDNGLRDGNRCPLHTQFGGNISAAGKADHLGEFLFGMADLRIQSCNLPIEERVKIICSMTETKLKMVQAQFADVFESKKPEDVTWMEWCLEFSFQKTSEFMALPFRIAAIVHRMTASEVEQMVDCGKSLGIIYQIFDDLVDIREGVKPGTLALTYQLAFLLDNGSMLTADEHEILDGIIALRELNNEDSSKLNELLRKYENVVIRAAMKEVQKRSQSVVLPQHVSGQSEVSEIVRCANQLAYWKYDAVDTSECV